MLDTNTVSAVMRSDSVVLNRLKRANRRDVLLPQPVLAEVAYGVARLPRSRRRGLLQERFDLIAATFERADWTDAVSTAFGDIKAFLERKERRIEDFDVAIAAHALANEPALRNSLKEDAFPVREILLGLNGSDFNVNPAKVLAHGHVGVRPLPQRTHRRGDFRP